MANKTPKNLSTTCYSNKHEFKDNNTPSDDDIIFENAIADINSAIARQTLVLKNIFTNIKQFIKDNSIDTVILKNVTVETEHPLSFGNLVNNYILLNNSITTSSLDYGWANMLLLGGNYIATNSISYRPYTLYHGTPNLVEWFYYQAVKNFLIYDGDTNTFDIGNVKYAIDAIDSDKPFYGKIDLIESPTIERPISNHEHDVVVNDKTVDTEKIEVVTHESSYRTDTGITIEEVYVSKSLIDDQKEDVTVTGDTDG